MPILAITQNTTVQNATPDSTFGGISEVAIRQENTGANYNADVNLALGNASGDNNVGILFLTSLSQVPVGATINSATLYMTASGGFGGFNLLAHRSLRTAVQTQATYNDFATGSAWTTPGARDATDRAAATDTATAISDAGLYAFNVTAAVTALVSAGTDQLIIAPETFDADGGYREFLKSTGTDGSRPELIIDYTAAGADTDPDAYTFTAQTDVPVSTVRTSNTVTISGINSAAPISVTGGEYSINGASYVSTSGTITNGDTVSLQGTSSASNGTTVNVVLTIGTVSGTFAITTVDAGAFTTVTYDGTALIYTGPGESESFKELIEKDYGDVLVAGDQVHWRIVNGTATGSTVATSTIPDFAAGVIDGEYEYTHNAVRSPTRTWTISDFQAPTSFVGTQAITIAENAAFSQIYTVNNASGATTLTGPDAAQFTLTDNGNSVTLSRAAFNFESPQDVGTDNVYNVTLNNNGVTHDVAVTVTNNTSEFTVNAITNATVNEGVAYTGPTPVVVGTPEGSIIWTLTGADAAQFSVVASTGVVSMVARNFASPTDANADNVYDVNLVATDSVSQTYSVSWTVSVQEVVASAPVITPGQTFTIPENSASGTSVGTLALTPNGTVTTITSSSSLINISPAGAITVGDVTSVPATVNVAATGTNEHGTGVAETFSVTFTDVDETVTPTAQDFSVSLTDASAVNVPNGVLGILTFTGATAPVTLSGANVGAFAVVGNELRLSATQAVGTYTATYTVTNADSDPGSTFQQQTSANISVTITDSTAGGVDLTAILDSLATLQTGVDTLSASVAGLLTSTDSRLDFLDVAVSTRLPTTSYVAPANATIAQILTAVNGLNDISTADIRTELAAELARIDVAISTRLATNTPVTLTAAERSAIAIAVETALLDETDGRQLINAIASSVSTANVDTAALTAAIRAEMERTGGLLDLTLKRNDARLNNLDAPISGISDGGGSVNLQPVLDAIALTMQANDPRIPQIVAAVLTTIPDMIADVPTVAENQAGMATTAQITALGSPVQTNDARLSNLDVAVSSAQTDLAPVLTAIAATLQSNDSRLASLTAIQTVTDQLTFQGGEVRAIVDKTGYSLTAAERTAIATAVEAALLNEGDGQQLLDAIALAIDNSNVDQVALVAAIRADLERSAGVLQSVLADTAAMGVPVQNNDARLNAIGAPLQSNDPRVANLDAAISSRATSQDFTDLGTDFTALQTSVNTVNTNVTGMQTQLTAMSTTVDSISSKLFFKSAYFDVNGQPTNAANAVREVLYAQDGTTVIATIEGRDVNGNPASGENIVEVVPI